jgi:hypothetical protein
MRPTSWRVKAFSTAFPHRNKKIADRTFGTVTLLTRQSEYATDEVARLMHGIFAQ